MSIFCVAGVFIPTLHLININTDTITTQTRFWLYFSFLLRVLDKTAHVEMQLFSSFPGRHLASYRTPGGPRSPACEPPGLSHPTLRAPCYYCLPGERAICKIKVAHCLSLSRYVGWCTQPGRFYDSMWDNAEMSGHYQR